MPSGVRVLSDRSCDQQNRPKGRFCVTISIMYKKIIFTLGLPVFLALFGIGCMSSNERIALTPSVTTTTRSIFRFENFPVSDDAAQQPSHAIDWTTAPAAKMFQTAITNQVKEGPNFAGHYSVATWGCGVACYQYAVIDDKTGVIIKFFGGNQEMIIGTDQSLTSSLLIINPPEAIKSLGDSAAGRYFKTEYYQMKNGQLVSVQD